MEPATASLLSDRIARKAVSRVQLRSDRQQDVDQLALTFVDPGITDQLDNDNNQVLYGRRGTGKTHALRVLGNVIESRPGETPAYVDLRTLGSSSIFEDGDRPLHVRAASLYKDVLAQVHSAILDYATDPARHDPESSGAPAAESVIDDLDALVRAVSRSALDEEVVKHEEQRSAGQDRQAGASLSLAPAPSAGLHLQRQKRSETRVLESREGRPRDHLLFGELSSALDCALLSAEIARFHLLLDEWTAIPLELQPLLAEFLKRTFFPLPETTVKIASLSYRSKFFEEIGGNVVGFQLGADVTTSLELEDYFVYDRSPERIAQTFAELLYRHVGSEIEQQVILTARRDQRRGFRTPLGPAASRSLRRLRDSSRMALDEKDLDFPYLRETFGVTDSARFTERLFADRSSFDELVRAGEGVVRDFIQIFTGAYFHAHRDARPTIDVDTVRSAAQRWFETDKETNVTPRQEAVLQTLVGEVVRRARLRAFRLDRRYEQDEVLRSLVDIRVLHVLRRGYADPGDPARRYTVYALDYGYYAHLLEERGFNADDFVTTSKPKWDDAVSVGPSRWVRAAVVDGDELRRRLERV